MTRSPHPDSSEFLPFSSTGGHRPKSPSPAGAGTADGPTDHRTTAERICGLDIARGIAVLGTLGTNIWLFSHPAGLLGSLLDPYAGLRPGAETLAYQLLNTLTNGKFLALLMMMFGIGVTLQYAAWQRRVARAEDRPGEGVRNRGWLRTYAPRAALLFVDGLVNFLLVAEFDILMGYAFTGFAVAAIIATSSRTATIWAWFAGAAHAALILLLSALLLLFPETVDTADGRPTPGATAWPLWNGINPYREAGFFELALFRLDLAAMFRAEPLLTFAMGVCLFTVGARLYDAGIFDSAGARLRRRAMLLGAAGVPADVALGVIGSPAAVLAQRYLTAILVAVGLLALIAHFTAPRDSAAVERPGTGIPGGGLFAAVGRMSLTCYVAQNVVAGALFYGWGLDLAGRLPDQRLLITILGFFAVLTIVVAFILTWQRLVRGPAARGPLEWLTRAALQRLR